ncbi:sensor histidine kinase [Luteolibacter sp. Populi]|uniref:sensor histidine kinase n=1 Tax=Luteolibacter sp. Populi TaxID=3230487 RepID=UPI0034668213
MNSRLPPDPGSPPVATWPQVLTRPEVRIVSIYFVAATIWILGSDRLLHIFMPESQVWLQSLKGINFVIATSVFLYFVLRRAFRGWRQAEREQCEMLSEVNVMFRNLSTRIEGLREADRTRISRELHDQLGQALTGLKMDLRWVERQLEVRDERALNPLTDRLVETQEQVDGLIDTVRRIATELRPDALDELGLPAALAEEAERFVLRTGMPCEVEVGELPEKLSPDVATAAFRIFQEALTNVVRHAEATRVKAKCVTTGEALELAVTDDGKGMPPGVERDGHSLGLLGMRERAELLGGKVNFTAPESGGTRVLAILPWKPSS